MKLSTNVLALCVAGTAALGGCEPQYAPRPVYPVMVLEPVYIQPVEPAPVREFAKPPPGDFTRPEVAPPPAPAPTPIVAPDPDPDPDPDYCPGCGMG